MVYRQDKGADMDATASSLFAAARRASGLSAEQACRICGVSRPTYNSREKEPEQFRLCELQALYAELDETGRELLMRGVAGVVERK